MEPEVLTKIPHPKHGTDFLAASHFKIGHEPRWLIGQDSKAYRSTFKNDYPPQPLGRKDKTILLPPADIMHRDERMGEYGSSVTRDHFGPKPLNKIEQSKLPYSLRATNFKMDADEKIKSFNTTHNEYFYEKSLKDAKDSSAKKDWSKSHIPQGDRDKITWPESDYRAHFVPKTGKMEKPHQRVKMDDSPTIKGDIRIHQNALYNTTMNDCFPSKYQNKIVVDESVRYPATHIPQGDQEKCNYLQSTQKRDYKVPEITERKQTERSDALFQLQSTSFRMGDPRLDSFRSTVQDSYQYIPGKGRKCETKMNMSKSSLPEGDSDYFKNVENFSTTIHRSQFKSPPAGYHNPKIDGSQIRTSSNVHLGDDHRLNSFTTTMNENFKKISSSCPKALGDVYTSSIPTDFYKDFVAEPTYRADYVRGEEVKKMQLNSAALNRLKQSNVNITDPSFREFGTTHRDTYTLKENHMERMRDLGKLQKSSVPLGTLSS